MSGTVPARIAFAVEAMDPQPGSDVLEIGCGGGVALALVCERLRGRGCVVGVDRSATQIDRARRRNRDGLDAGLAELRVGEFPGVDLPGSFDLVFAVNVPSFRSDDPAAPTAVASLLRPTGELWVFDEPPPGLAVGPVSMRISALLARCGYAIVDIVEGGRTVGVRAAPADVTASSAATAAAATSPR
ncbi:class I SAM-dependent methyltransferase [Rhodococcus sp. GXMU-t2271]|uniref:Class I SAM-dependent methyltransferase n=1 Tax=Rhodococcus indonesiensis TaxID=3055869 RepID=A0ABT7RGZ9_9NOCA|nr:MULTISPECIES: class I SAM-dependent methyltransferase [Rhodococcus]MDM7486920.1 class I SAM-dependent methyltransferase [Rhodococcus indonesiensis]